MNLKRIKELRKFIAKLPPRAIRMEDWVQCDRSGETIAQARKHSCGTKACIAGWTVLAFHPKQHYKINNFGEIGPRKVSVDTTAQKLLGLEEWEAQKLFMGEWVTNPIVRRRRTSDDPFEMPTRKKSFSRLSKADVLKQLDHMIETGEI